MRRVLPVLLSAATLFAVRPLHAGDLNKAQDFLNKAHDNFREGDFSSALSALSKSLSQHSGFLPAYALRAQVRHVLNDRDGMRRDIQSALRISSPRTPDLLTLRGDVRLMNGDLELARKDYEDAIALDREFPDAYLGMGRLYRALGNDKEAIRHWHAALKLDPNLHIARYDLARAYYEMGEKDSAIREATLALRGNPTFHLPYNILGMIFVESGDYDRAFKAYSKAIRLNSEFTYAYMSRGLAYINNGKTLLGLNDLKQAVSVAKGDYAPYYNRGEVYFRLGRKEEAFADYNKVLALEVSYPPAAQKVGERFLAAEKPNEAAEMFSKTLAMAARHPDTRMRSLLTPAHLNRAKALEGLKKYPKAMEDLNDAVKLSSASALPWTARGRLQHRLGKDALAMADFEQALKLDPKFAPALLARGNVHAKARKYVEALKDYSAAVAADPDSSDAYNNRGVLYANAFDEFDRAVDDMKKAVALESTNAGYQLNLGIVLHKRKDFWLAIEALELAERKQAPQARVLLYRSKARFALGDATRAFADIDEALAMQPNNSELMATKGLFYLSQREYNQALKVLKKAVGLDKKNDTAYVYQGRAYGGLGEYSRASRSFREGAKWAEKPTEALTDLCQSERLRGHARRAVQECEKALRYNPDHGPAYVQRGLAFLELGDYPKAIRDLDDGGRLTPPRAEIYLARSIAHVPLKQYRESDEAYREAMALDYTVRFADVTFGLQPDAKWDYETRIDSFGRQLEHDGDNPYTNLVRGNALHNAGYFDRAILEYTRAMETNGRLTAAYLDRGAALSAQESLDAAEFDLRRAVELSPHDPETHIGLVTLLTSRGKYPQALKTVIAALSEQSENPNPHTFVKAGNLRYFLKDIKRAKVNYKLALKFDPSHAAAYNGLGLCHFARREYKEALENFSRAIALEPQHERYLRNRASTFVNMRDFANATSDYRLALKVNRDPLKNDEYANLIRNSEQKLKSDDKRASAKEKAKSSDQ